MVTVGSGSHVPSDINKKLQSIVGQSISTIFVRGKRLCIGFGEVSKATTIAHGEWEVGTYDCSWRVVRDNRVVCASNDAIDIPSELEDSLKACDLGEFVGVMQLSELDTRFIFTHGNLDILCTISDDDEILHVFFPDKEVATLSVSEGWVLGRSDRGWHST